MRTLGAAPIAAQETMSDETAAFRHRHQAQRYRWHKPWLRSGCMQGCDFLAVARGATGR